MKLIQLEDEGNTWHLITPTRDEIIAKTDESHLLKEIYDVLLEIHKKENSEKNA